MLHGFLNQAYLLRIVSRMFLLFFWGLVSLEGQPVKLLATPDGGIQPQAAVDAKGVVHLIYFKGEPGAGDIFYVRRGPGEETFSKPIQVNSQPHTAMAMGTIRGAQLAVGKNGRVHVAWDGMGEGTIKLRSSGMNGLLSPTLSSKGGEGEDPEGSLGKILSSTAGAPATTNPAHAHEASDAKQPLFYTRLNDAGTAFEPERNVITYAYGLDGGSSVAADPEGNVYVAWHAPKPGSTN